ncbi:MAG: zinc ribbon domain-containing protein [Gammaproteobacteria bacterium]|nr:zinc ribbon domain-containing protein [Gammaproteobacteria bacterium]MBQ0840724.1 zinc ribbon domain-containing protein [Gammaproteobacteria bacterium]
MPIYEYQCESCKETHEALQKISDALLTECPNCGEQALKKQLTASAFRLSGSGWYETDFKTGDKKKNLAGGGSGEGASGNSKKEAGDGGAKKADSSSSDGGKKAASTASS